MNEIHLPWSAWYRDATHRLLLPDSWTIDVLGPADAPACPPAALRQAFEFPFDGAAVRRRAAGCKSACIVVDDLARPTPAALILPLVLEELHQAGLKADRIRIVAATGSHGVLDRERLARKVGSDICERYDVSSHDCRTSLAATGIQYGNRELLINRTFLESDFKIAVGSVLPHSFAGYSGGAKLILPGLADLHATSRSHQFVQMGFRGGADLSRNRFRLEAEDLARRLGLGCVVNVLTNSRREISAVVVGNLVSAHRRACELAQAQYRTPIQKTYDCLVINAYPKDLDLLQAENAFIPLKTARSPLVRDEGVVVLASAASEGLGRHGLFEPGGLNYSLPRPSRALGSRELWLYVPGVSADEVHRLYWEGYPVFHEAHDLCAALSRRLPVASAGVLPCGPMQQVDDLRPAATQVA